jgi:hypothetical protein
MRRQLLFEVAQSAQNTIANPIHEASRHSADAWEIDQFSEAHCNHLDFLRIQAILLWHEPEAPDLTKGDGTAGQRKVHTAPPGLGMPLQEGTV